MTSHQLRCQDIINWVGVTIMATWFPIWALHRKPSCKNVLLELQVANSSASIKSPTPSIILAPITVHCNCDYFDVLEHVPCCHVRCMRHVQGAMSCELALTWLWWICGSYMPSSCVWTGQAAAAGNAHWPQWEEPRSEKLRSKERSDLLHWVQKSVSGGKAGLTMKPNVDNE